MKTTLVPFISAAAAALLIAGCQTGHDKGPYAAQTPKSLPLENTERFVLLDPGARYSVTCSGYQDRTLDDGRLEVLAQVRNRENRRVEIQVNCVFKDGSGFSTGDETPFQALLLTENATEQVRFVSANALARKYTIRVRQAR
jgi:hypothetical protein